MKDFTIKLQLLELSQMAYHILIECNIARKKIRLLIDTGASQSLIDEELVNKLNVDTAEILSKNLAIGIGNVELEPKICTINKLKIENLTIENMPFIVLSIKHINETYKQIGIKPIAGIIGMDLLIALMAKIDLCKKEIIFYNKSSTFNFEKYL